LFHSLYGNYCHNQEKRTPNFQRFFEKYKELKVQADPRIPDVEKELLEGSRPLMAYTNLLTFNSRAIALYITALLNCPWVFLLFEIIVLTSFYIHMHHSHERLCGRLLAKMEDIKS
jgi:hypothetical protein